jgi:hypothetical protein
LLPAWAVRRTGGRNSIERSPRRKGAELGIPANLVKQAALSLFEHDPVYVPFLDCGNPRPLRFVLGVAIERPVSLEDA